MNTANIVEITLRHNGMEVGKSTSQTLRGSFLSFLDRSGFKGYMGGKKKILLLLILIVSAGIYANYSFVIDKDRIYQKLNALYLIPREEPYTALYFEYYDDLPTKVAAGEMVSFTFTIKNAEGVDREYPYKAYFKTGDSRKRLAVDAGTVSIKSGESQTISRSYTFTQDHAQEILYVELPESGQTIHFILKSDEIQK